MLRATRDCLLCGLWWDDWGKVSRARELVGTHVMSHCLICLLFISRRRLWRRGPASALAPGCGVAPGRRMPGRTCGARRSKPLTRHASVHRAAVFLAAPVSSSRSPRQRAPFGRRQERDWLEPSLRCRCLQGQWAPLPGWPGRDPFRGRGRVSPGWQAGAPLVYTAAGARPSFGSIFDVDSYGREHRVVLRVLHLHGEVEGAGLGWRSGQDVVEVRGG